ncbi:LysM peptidoglycan-binding domain-containing protein [Microbacterium oleivorans]|uniref:LysM peptidoglycan-binding domain-containing protein n=1 Tax=Microbacterium TaxID=33882 RepID=UPI0020409422|nr:LysM peptidoglycan-binding domain-containing protein [Microbacterium oleivorans]MCM3697429.1 LysM peptidoglycan-binding domain-containing protein [Microbacterium oleivorans]
MNPTIAISTAPVVRTRLRLTTRGRRVLAAVAALPVVVALGVGILSSGGALASGEAGASSGSFDTVTVMPGESLWTIAQDIAPDSDPRDVIDEIVRLNALSSSAVDAGQSLAIPAAFSAQAGE